MNYRGVYILNNDCNMVFGTLYIPFAKMAIMLAIVLSVFALVRLYNDLHILSLFLLTSVAFTATILIGPISIAMSSLYDMSSKFPHNLFLQIHITPEKNSRIYKLQLKSCQLIRSQVGNFYYMESKAKLTVIHNILNGIVFLLVNVK